MLLPNKGEFFNCVLKNDIKQYMLHCTTVTDTTVEASNQMGIISILITDIINVSVLTNIGVCVSCKVPTFVFHTYADGRCTICHKDKMKVAKVDKPPKETHQLEVVAVDVSKLL